jgi:hypothetical protein
MLAALAIFACGFLAAGRAQAEISEAERQLLRQGIQERQAGNDEAAREVFARAYEEYGSGTAAAQLGLAEQALGLFVAAEKHLRAALETEDPFVEQNRDVLEQSLETVRSRLGTLDVKSNVEGAELYVNGELRGTLPLEEPLRVVGGTVQMRVKAEGYVSQTRTREVRPGGFLRERFSLFEREPEPAVVDPAAAGQGSVEPSQRERSRAMVGLGPGQGAGGEPADEADGGIVSKWWFWTIIGAVVAGGAATGIALAARDDGADTGELIQGDVGGVVFVLERR